MPVFKCVCSCFAGALQFFPIPCLKQCMITYDTFLMKYLGYNKIFLYQIYSGYVIHSARIVYLHIFYKDRIANLFILLLELFWKHIKQNRL